jgi:two-component system, NtrC family, sensor histidine kinase PilS
VTSLERRRNERRSNDRRATDRADAVAAESLFGSLVGGDSRFHEDAIGGAGGDDATTATRQRRAAPSWDPSQHGDRAGTASGFARGTRDADGASLPRVRGASAQATSARLYRVFVGARATLGLALVMALVAQSFLGARPPLPVMLVALAYAAQALVLWILPMLRGTPSPPMALTRGQWAVTIGLDLLVFTLMHWLQGTPADNNFLAMLLMPVLMSAVLVPRRVALASTAYVALMLLVRAGYDVFVGGQGGLAWVQAGMVGMGFFAVTLLSSEVAARIERGELAARSGLELARQQAQLNRLVIEEMSDGVLVVDRRVRVRAANPAARRLLVRDGEGPLAPFHLDESAVWSELEQLLMRAFEHETWPIAVTNATLKFDDGTTRSLRARARFTRRRSHPGDDAESQPSEVFCVVFLEDLRAVQERTRQEKLAAMGRVSAGIAHEIRNPLAAIAQANALLREEARDSEQEMLTRMVSENVERLKLIVDDVMAVAPSGDVGSATLDAVTVVGTIVGDWARASGLAIDADTRLRVVIEETSLPVHFDPEHLRRVLVNLLDNARRYASQEPGAITLQLARHTDDAHALLTVRSDGEPIGPDIEPYLFEPFFSTRSRGTGLGLYICRELCERYGATIDYWQHPQGQRHRNDFRVVLRIADASAMQEPRLLP